MGEINLWKIQEFAQTIKFLIIQWVKGHREILSKAKQKKMEFKTLQNKREAQKIYRAIWFLVTVYSTNGPDGKSILQSNLM